MELKQLNGRHIQFCKEYVIDRNATRAAKDAGYSERTAASIGSRLLRNVKIQEQVQKEIKAREFRTEITADRTLQEIALLAYSDAADLFEIDEAGQLTMKTLDEIPTHMTRVIESIGEDRVIKESADGTQVTVYDKIKYKLHSKPRALEMLARHLSLYPDQRLSVDLNAKFNGDPIEVSLNFIHTNGIKPKKKD